MGSSVFLLSFALLAVVHTERNFRFFIDIFEFENADWKVFETLNSQLVQLNNRSFVSGSWTLRHSVSRFDVRAFIDLINTNNQRKRVFEVRVDGCKFLTRDHKRFLFRVITKTIQKHASANLMCPLQSVSFGICFAIIIIILYYWIPHYYSTWTTVLPICT